MKDQILRLNGLSVETLESLSYESNLGFSLKKTIRHFEKSALLKELTDMTNWLDEQQILREIAADYRVKSVSSILNKYERYSGDSQVRKVFNDVLGFRAFCDDYRGLDVLKTENFRIVVHSEADTNDDGYRGVHVYYQKSNRHYPIEIQFNTLYDRQMNNWLHSYIYKKNVHRSLGCELRRLYESGKIRSETEFKEALENVLSDSKR